MAYTTGFQFAYTTTGGPPVIKNLELNTGTAYHAGALLRIVATTANGQRVATRATTCAGILACDVAAANATAPNKYPIYMAGEQNVFSIKMPFSRAPITAVGQTLPVTLGTIHNYHLCGTASATAANNILTVVGYKGDESESAHTGCEYYVKISRSIFGSTKTDPAS